MRKLVGYCLLQSPTVMVLIPGQHMNASGIARVHFADFIMNS